MSTAQKPWEHAKSGGSEHDALAARFVESLSYDTRLFRQDIAGSIIHSRMLRAQGLLSGPELAAIERGLGEILAEIEAAGVTGWGGWKLELEDVHMCIEAALIEKIGDPGRKLHTGRSRNDQVALDLKLWIDQEALPAIRVGLIDLLKAFISMAERDGMVVMPSYTHLQRAQPIVSGGELLAWAAAFDRSLARLLALRDVSVAGSPLGSGAIAGSSLPIDRPATAAAAGLGLPMSNSIDATATRDAAIDFLYTLATIGMNLSRWAEQWIIYMTSEFAMLTIGDAFTTGSSMMPQKRNPDMLELIRGRASNLYGSLFSILALCKGLPLGYNRDLQEDKRHLFAGYDMALDCLKMASAIVRSASFRPERIGRDLDRGFLDATSLAEYLVGRGVPFRTAHQHVGRLVRLCEERGCGKLADLPLEAMREICPDINADVADWLGAANVVKRYQSAGNGGVSGFQQQLAAFKERLKGL